MVDVDHESDHPHNDRDANNGNQDDSHDVYLPLAVLS